jgi:uncharacterized membrane protein
VPGSREAQQQQDVFTWYSMSQAVDITKSAAAPNAQHEMRLGIVVSTGQCVKSATRGLARAARGRWLRSIHGRTHDREF